MYKRVILFTPSGNVPYAMGVEAFLMSFENEIPVRHVVRDIQTDEERQRVEVFFEGTSDRVYYNGIPFSVVELNEQPMLRPEQPAGEELANEVIPTEPAAIQSTEEPEPVTKVDKGSKKK